MEKEKLIKLSGGQWHYHLLKFTFDVEPKEIKNLCLYFWLTVASIFVCPFVVVWKCLKLLWKFTGYISNMAFGRIDSYFYNSSFKKIVDNSTNGQIYFLVNYRGDDKLIGEADSRNYCSNIIHLWLIKHCPLSEFVKPFLKAKGISEKDIERHKSINILTTKPIDIDNYSVIEGLNVTAPELRNDFYTIKITVPFAKGKNIYPTLKIYRK